jgi:hypothetical protein
MQSLFYIDGNFDPVLLSQAIESTSIYINTCIFRTENVHIYILKRLCTNACESNNIGVFYNVM